jgi:hypothetical protein
LVKLPRQKFDSFYDLQICHHSITAADCRHDLTSHIFNLKRVSASIAKFFALMEVAAVIKSSQHIVFIKRQAAYLGLPLNLYLFDSICEQMYGVSYGKWL